MNFTPSSILHRALLCVAVLGLSLSPSLSLAANPTADEVLDKMVDYIGSKDTLENIKTRVMVTEMEAQGMKLQNTVYQKLPNKILNKQVIPQMGEMRQGFNGEVAWMFNPIAGGTTIMDGSQKSAMEYSAPLDQHLRLDELYSDRELIGKDKVGDKDAWVIQMKRKQTGSLEKWYISTDEYQLMRMVAQMPADVTGGEPGDDPIVVTTDLKNYKTVNDINVPHRMEVNMRDMQTVMVVKEIKFNEPLDDSLFDPPANDAGAASAAQEMLQKLMQQQQQQQTQQE